VVDKLIRLFYTPDAINFAQLGDASGAFADADHYQNAIRVYHFLIAGDFFERAGSYSELIETLKEPRVFNRYKRLVLDQVRFQTTTCGIPHEVAFHPALLEHEPRRDR